MNHWPLVPLKQLLIPINRPEVVDPEKTYKILGAHWYAHGLYTKDVLTGQQIRAKRVHRVHQGDFVYNRLFAWKGSFALASVENHGCYVSNEFPCFEVNSGRLDGRFLWRYLSRESSWAEALGLSTGGTPTSRNRLKEEAFLAISVPLPPIDEQRHLVQLIDTVVTKAEMAKRLHDVSCIELLALLNSVSRENFVASKEAEVVTLDYVCETIIDCPHSNPVYADEGIPTIRSPDVGWGQLSFGRARKTDEFEYKRRTARGEPKAGDIVVVREGGGTGKAALVENGQRFSLGQRVMMLRPDCSRIEPKFLLYQWLSPLVYKEQISTKMKGSASPHLNIGAVRQFNLRLPPLPFQRRIVQHLEKIRTKVAEMQALQTQIKDELDAIVPSVLDRAFKGEL